MGLDLGCAGCGFSASAQIGNAFGAFDPAAVKDNGGGDAQYLISSLFPLFSSSYSNGLWFIELFLPDEWIFNRENLDERFRFLATNTRGGPDQLVDGVTQFANIRWILSNSLPILLPAASIPEPATYLLAGMALISIAVVRRRKLSIPSSATPPKTNSDYRPGGQFHGRDESRILQDKFNP